MLVDYLVVGAGLAGCTVAERLAEADKSVLIVEKRNHIGGNCFDYYDDAGVLVHKYGPHIFHTDSAEVLNYLSRFTEWIPYEHRVLASVDGQLVPFPINLDTINQLYGEQFSQSDLRAWLDEERECGIYDEWDYPLEPRNAMETLHLSIGRDLTEKFYAGYSRKQWGLALEQLDPSVVSRVSARTNRDERYFTDRYQMMPAVGYTRMFERMLAHPNIKIMLKANVDEVKDFFNGWRNVVYTGPIDEFYGHQFGRLPYRSARFEFRTLAMPIGQHYQPAAVVNYPNLNDYTRITEFRQMTGQEVPFTTVATETPCRSGEPFHPILTQASAVLYRQYRDLADKTPGVEFVGRLGNFEYLNMDQTVERALSVATRILEKEQTA